MFHQALPFLLFLGCHSDKADLSSSVCDASGNYQNERREQRYLFPSFNYRNGLGDQRLLWFQTALKLAHSLSRTLVLPPFWVPDTDGDQYQDEKAHFEPFENLYEPSAFESYNTWITYAAFRQRMNATIRLLYMSPREAKNRHSIECSSGETLTSAGSLEIFGDVWKYSKLRCLETREMMEPFMRSKAQVIALNTRNNQELPGYRMEVLPPRECNQTQWPFHMAFNQSLVKAARSFMETLPASFLAVHWRHGTSMHKDSAELVEDVHNILKKYDFKPERIFLSSNCQEPEDLAVLAKELALPVSQFQDPSFAPWQRALIDMIVASEAPYFVPSSYSSSFAKTILFHRVKGNRAIEETKMHC